ncbi:MAG: hypothetical protein K2M07_06850 [Muribaculaceae bacterium]|nr:hypothetical protein [Muribaculaceae bacterium]
MKKLTRFAVRDAVAAVSAIPFKNDSGSLSGKTVAAIALTMVALKEVDSRFGEAVAAIAEKVKPEGYDRKSAEREKAIKDMFGDAPFDPEKWERECLDKEFEEVYRKCNEEFHATVGEVGREETEVDIRLTAEHLSDIAGVLVAQDAVDVAGSQVPVQGFLYMLASLI